MNYIFYHMFCLNDYLDRFEKTLNKIKNFGLYESVEKIFINIVGKNNCELDFSKYRKIEISRDCENTIGEGSTLNLIWNKCQNLKNEDNILYLHSKGVWRSYEDKNEKENVQAWIDLMEFFLIEKWNESIFLLRDYDACGINLASIKDGHQHPHFSGNFWWTTASYIKRTRSFTEYFGPGQDAEIQPIEKRIYAEWWLLNSLREGIANPCCLHDSKVNHYTTFYDRSNYASNPPIFSNLL